MIENSAGGARVPRMLWILLAGLLLVRLGMVLAYPGVVRAMPQWEWSNNDGYDLIAVQWVDTGTFGFAPDVPTAARLPLYPALIALGYRIAGDHYPAAVMVIQALLSVITGWLLWRLADRLFDRRVAAICLGLFILNPHANNFVFRCATETVFVFLVTGWLEATTRMLRSGRFVDAAVAAVWLGLALLTRQTLVPLAALGLVLLVFRARFTSAPGRRLLHLCGVSLVLASLTGPWLARNHARSGSFPVFQTWVGAPMFQGVYVSRNLDEFLRRHKTVSELDIEADRILRGETELFLAGHAGFARPIAREVMADRYARDLATSALAENPGRTAGQVLRNVVLAPVLQLTWRSTHVLMAWNYPLLLLAAIGGVACFRSDRSRFLAATPILFVFGYLLLVHSIVWPQARYILPGLVPLTVFSAHGLATLAGRPAALGRVSQGEIT